MKEITGLYVNPQKNIAEARTIEDRLESFYKLLECGCIDIVTRQIGGRAFSIVCDDEGTFKDDPYISAAGMTGVAQLVGPLFVVSADNADGDLVGLSDSEIRYLLRHIIRVQTKKHKEITAVLFPVSYLGMPF